MSKKLLIKHLGWQDAEQSNKLNSLYQDFRWLKIIQQAFGHESVVLIAEESGLQRAYLPLVKLRNPIFGNSLISLPFLNGGGLFFDQSNSLPAMNQENNFSNQEIAEAIYQALESKISNYDYLELRTNSKDLSTHPNFICRDHKVTFILKLNSNPQLLLETFSKKLRAQIKRPEKSSAQSRVIKGSEISENDINLFYQTIAEHWRDLGSPIYPKKFFELVISEFKEQVLLSFVEINNHVSSVGLTIIQDQQAEICWAASLKEFNLASPNMLLYWSTIEKLCELGIKTFDFGRCTKDSGTYHFKKQWGGSEEQLYWYYLKSSKKIPNISADNPKFKLAVKVWKRLPVWLATFIGNRISKFFP